MASAPLHFPVNPSKTSAPGSALARFFELRGRRIVKACGSLWYSVHGRFLMSLPYEAMLNPDQDEVLRMIRETRSCGARFSSIAWTGLESGLYILRRGAYSIETLHIKHRPRVRRALQCFEIRPAEKSELLLQGLSVNRSTMARQGRCDQEFGSARHWERLVEAAFSCPQISFPAAFAGKRLAAYMVTCREGGWLHILHQMSRQEDLPNFPNHVLTFSVSSAAAADESLSCVCYGCIPLFGAGGLHEYKLRFGYRAVPHRSAIQLHPAIDIMLNNGWARTTLRLARRGLSGNQRLETIETVLEGARSSHPPNPEAHLDRS